LKSIITHKNPYIDFWKALQISLLGAMLIVKIENKLLFFSFKKKSYITFAQNLVATGFEI
jgi:hypothetical protein